MLGGRRKEINDTVANLQRHSTIVLTGGNRGGEGATAAATSPPYAHRGLRWPAKNYPEIMLTPGQ